MRRPSALAGVGQHDCATGLAAGEPDALHTGLGLKILDDDRQRLSHARSGGEGAADPEQRARFARAPRRVVGALGLERRQPADDDADEQEQEQVEPFGWVVDVQGEARLDEERVVQDERCDGGRAGGEGPEYDCDTDDGHEI